MLGWQALTSWAMLVLMSAGDAAELVVFVRRVECLRLRAEMIVCLFASPAMRIAVTAAAALIAELILLVGIMAMLRVVRLVVVTCFVLLLLSSARRIVAFLRDVKVIVVPVVGLFVVIVMLRVIIPLLARGTSLMSRTMLSAYNLMKSFIGCMVFIG